MYEVNRSVFIAIPQQPFWDWLVGISEGDLGDLTLEDLQQDANSYLLPPCENADQVWEEIENRVEDIFAAELADWYDDDSAWPELTFDNFQEWFDVVLSSITTDLSSDALKREKFQSIDL